MSIKTMMIVLSVLVLSGMAAAEENRAYKTYRFQNGNNAQQTVKDDRGVTPSELETLSRSELKKKLDKEAAERNKQER